jgi:hypothetical protein
MKKQTSRVAIALFATLLFSGYASAATVFYKDNPVFGPPGTVLKSMYIKDCGFSSTMAWKIFNPTKLFAGCQS